MSTKKYKNNITYRGLQKTGQGFKMQWIILISMLKCLLSYEPHLIIRDGLDYNKYMIFQLKYSK